MKKVMFLIFIAFLLVGIVGQVTLEKANGKVKKKWMSRAKCQRKYNLVVQEG